jgi:hypothetical protein
LQVEQEENPVWARNRPGKRGRAQAWTFYGTVAVAWALAVAAHQTRIYAGRSFILPVALVITLLECLGGYALVSGFAGFGARPRELEDLVLTRLTFDEIVYGIYDAGIRQALWLFLPLQVLEVVLLGVQTGGLYLVLIVFTPVQWVVLCKVLQLAVRDRSRMHSLPTVETVTVSLGVLALAGLATGVLGLFFGLYLFLKSPSMDRTSNSAALLIALALFWWLAYQLGRVYLDEAHAEAVGNYEDFINGDHGRNR